jgi:NAD(P)-dependent dehydrogenase (short-subunit alcohol dehydrogenase family)
MKIINELFSLKNKIAIVTGATGLLGRHHCYALSEAGATVIVCDLHKKKSKEFAEELSNDSVGYKLDVTNLDSVETVKDKVMKKYGKIDILINNAAINDKFEDKTSTYELSKFENYPLDLWQSSFNVNVTGTFLCCQIFGKEMAEKGKGSIINIASTYGIVAPKQSLYKDKDKKQVFYKTPSYPATKGAVLSLTRFLASYWGEKNVRVNSLSPGGVESGQDKYFIKNYSDNTPLNRMAFPTDYKGAIVFLASDASSYMTGSNLIIDGGYTIW